jgi:hypothetical protein
MSSKGTVKSIETRAKISKSKTKINKLQLITSSKSYIEELQANPKQLPTISGLILSLGISSSYFYELANQIPELEEIINHIKLMQENYLLTNGVISKSNPVFSMFLLKCKHDYRDNPQNLTQNNYMNISPDVLKDALKLMNEN